MAAPRHRPLRPALAACLCAVAILGGACSGGDARESATMRSGERPERTTSTELPPTTGTTPTNPPSTTPDTGSGGGDLDALCDSFRRYVDSQPGDSAEAMLEAIDEWQELAPEELQDDLDALEGMVTSLQELDETDPASIGRMLDTLLQPGLRESIEEITTFAIERCSVDLGPVDLDPGELGEFGGPPGD